MIINFEKNILNVLKVSDVNKLIVLVSENNEIKYYEYNEE
jgi:hypothetical protein